MAQERSVWSGQLVDANGRKASIEVHFMEEKKVAAWKLQLYERDGEPIEMEGESPFEGQNLEEPIKLQSAQELPDGGVVRWEIALEPADAAMYARRAQVGSYRAASEGSKVPLPLSRGVLVLWQFES
ncbi:MAG: hypothetical protein OEM84_00730 [Acidimicrobiia bacterium]|nr:hypothetical protein [Acidimicrobiia bacterium]